MARREVKIVARTIEIGWHRRDEIAPELAAICLTQLDARDLRNCIPLVCFLEWSVSNSSSVIGCVAFRGYIHDEPR